MMESMGMGIQMGMGMVHPSPGSFGYTPAAANGPPMRAKGESQTPNALAWRNEENLKATATSAPRATSTAVDPLPAPSPLVLRQTSNDRGRTWRADDTCKCETCGKFYTSKAVRFNFFSWRLGGRRQDLYHRAC